jgi:hypothetical protein
MNRAALTIELDENTANSLRNLTKLWAVPPEEAIARAVRATEQALVAPPTADLLPAFRQLQQAAGITAEKATQWKDAMHDARR